MANQSIVRLAQFKNDQCLTFKQAINTANDKRITLMPNRSSSEDVTEGFDGRLVQTNTWKGEKEIYPACTGTMVFYGKKDAPLPKTIETEEKWVFDTGEVAGAKNIVMAINHGFKQDGTPLIKLHEEGIRTVIEVTDPKAIKVLENFPVESGFYLPDNEFGIPIGEKVSDSNPNQYFIYLKEYDRYYSLEANEYARYLHRSEGGNICLIVRNLDGSLMNFISRAVLADGKPSYLYGVLGIVTDQKQNENINPKNIEL